MPEGSSSAAPVITPGPRAARKRRVLEARDLNCDTGPNGSILNAGLSIIDSREMEEAEVPLEHLHEEIHHRAEHGGEKWISWVALSTAILAVLAAIAGLLSGSHANEAMMSQIQASDQWGYYQAKSVKAAVLDAKMSLAGTAPNEQDHA